MIVGDDGVGKTTLLISYTEDKFPEEYIPTVFGSLTVNSTVDGTTVGLSFWDTSGGSDYDKLRPLAYNDTDIFLLCFAIDNPGSYANITAKWYPELTHYCPTVPVILLGTKSDLRGTPSNSVSNEQGNALSKEINAKRYLESSARLQLGKKLQFIFDELVRVCFENRKSKKQNKGCHLL